MKLRKQYWFETLVIRGREGEDPYERDDKGEIVVEDGEQVLKDGWEYDEKDEPVKVENLEGEEDTPEKKLADTEEALRKERILRRKAEREAKLAKKGKKVEEVQENKEELEAERSKTSRLAKGLLDTKMDTAIEKAARKAGFIDPTDALIAEVRAEIDYDQDDNDPSQIDIDFDSVMDAVEALGKKKQHLLRSKEETDEEKKERQEREARSGTPSGSRLRRRRTGNEDKIDEAALVGNYPSLGG